MLRRKPVARSPIVAIAVAAAVAVGACRTTTYGETLDTWVGAPADALIVQWGPPDEEYPLARGRTLLVYRDTAELRASDIAVLSGLADREPEPCRRAYDRQWTRERITPDGFGGYTIDSDTMAGRGPCYSTRNQAYEQFQRSQAIDRLEEAGQRCETRFVVSPEREIIAWSYEGAGC